MCTNGFNSFVPNLWSTNSVADTVQLVSFPGHLKEAEKLFRCQENEATSVPVTLGPDRASILFERRPHFRSQLVIRNRSRRQSGHSLVSGCHPLTASFTLT